ncbi:hypothetical protein L2E82_48243 [Cichorium intybus]|uniref:Uncharacterized protein n=1 Tax=Cichorium intybus TaxID=13427 RepID=A0ACB8YZ77_CICIN|nr:hypothetical protein L2E82_48243 [Cichorium intybus]
MHNLSEHPNVVRIKGTYKDVLYVHIVMELCASGDLFDRIVQKGQYSEREAAKLIKTIVGVVEACHLLGLMHRDLTRCMLKNSQCALRMAVIRSLKLLYLLGALTEEHISRGEY